MNRVYKKNFADWVSFTRWTYIIINFLIIRWWRAENSNTRVYCFCILRITSLYESINVKQVTYAYSIEIYRQKLFVCAMSTMKKMYNTKKKFKIHLQFNSVGKYYSSRWREGSMEDTCFIIIIILYAVVMYQFFLNKLFSRNIIVLYNVIFQLLFILRFNMVNNIWANWRKNFINYHSVIRNKKNSFYFSITEFFTVTYLNTNETKNIVKCEPTWPIQIVFLTSQLLIQVLRLTHTIFIDWLRYNIVVVKMLF